MIREKKSLFSFALTKSILSKNVLHGNEFSKHASVFAIDVQKTISSLRTSSTTLYLHFVSSPQNALQISFISHGTKAVRTKYISEVPYPAPPLLSGWQLIRSIASHTRTLSPPGWGRTPGRVQHTLTYTTSSHSTLKPNNRLNWRIYFRKYTASVIGQLFFPAAIYISFRLFI